MAFPGMGSNKNLKATIRSMGVFLLILFYLAINTEFALFHQILDTQANDPHTYTAEEDPCHRAIFHNEPEENCGHESHMLLKSKCEFCDAICKSDKSIDDYEFNTRCEFSKEFQTRIAHLVSTKEVTDLASRGPPAA